MSAIKLSYFNFEARGEASRLAFHLGNTPFEDDRFTFQKMQEMKKEGKFKYDQVPVLYIDGKQYAQSLAILRYAGRIGHLYPQDPLEQMKTDEYIYSVEEVYSKVVQTFVDDEEEKKKRRIEFDEKTVRPWLGFLNREISQSSSGYFGKSLSIADIYLFTLLRFIKKGTLDYVSNDTSSFKGLENFFNMMSSLPKITEWYEKHQPKSENK